MRVCFVAQAFVRYPSDLIGSFVFRLAEEVSTRGIAVSAVVPHAAGLPGTETMGRTQVVRFRYAPERYERLAYQGIMHNLVKGSTLNKLLLGSFLASFVVSTVRTVRQQKPDLIHAHWWFPSGLVGAIAARVTGIPLVITCHGTDVGLLGQHAIVDAVARWVFGRASAVTAVSTHLQQNLVRHLPGLAGRVSVIPMPVDRVFVEPAPRVPARHEGSCTIMAAGRLSRQKGLHDLVSAAAMLVARGMDVRVLLVGNGEEEQALRELAERLHIQDRVMFPGAHPAGDLAAYYRSCDVAALPSLEEGLGLALVEAMFCGTPVVGSRSGGIADIVSDGETGLLVPPGNALALADAFERVLSDESYAERLGRAGQAHVRSHFDPDACVEKMVAVYRSVLAHRRL